MHQTGRVDHTKHTRTIIPWIGCTATKASLPPNATSSKASTSGSRLLKMEGDGPCNYCVPSVVAHGVWSGMNRMDKAVAVSIAYQSLSKLYVTAGVGRTPCSTSCCSATSWCCWSSSLPSPSSSSCPSTSPVTWEVGTLVRTYMHVHARAYDKK